MAFSQNVGIGTMSPKAKLEVVGASSDSLPLLRVGTSGSPIPYLIVEQTNGYVGIKVASPSEALDISGNIRFTGSLMPAGNAGAPGQVLISQGPGTPPQWQTLNMPSQGDSVCLMASNNYVQKWTGTELCNSQIIDDGTNVGIGITSPAAKLDVNGYVRARTGYGDWIEIGGDGAGNDVEIQISAPPTRDWITFWNSNTSQVSNIKVGKIDLRSSLMPSGNPGSVGQVLESRGPGLSPVWKSLGSRVYFTSSTSNTTTSPTTLTLTLSGLNGGEKILILGDGWANGDAYGRVEVRLKHNSTTVAFRRYSVHDYGWGFNNADFSLSIIGVVTATAGTNTIQLELKRTGGSVRFRDRSLTAIVF